MHVHLVASLTEGFEVVQIIIVTILVLVVYEDSLPVAALTHLSVMLVSDPLVVRGRYAPSPVVVVWPRLVVVPFPLHVSKLVADTHRVNEGGGMTSPLDGHQTFIEEIMH